MTLTGARPTDTLRQAAELASALLLIATACAGPAVDSDAPDVYTGNETPARVFNTEVPAEARLHRLTDSEYRASVTSLLQVPVPSALPVDLRLHGFSRVGAAELSIAPLEVDLYEAAAWDAAARALPDAAARDQRLGCPIDAMDDPEPCVSAWAHSLAHRAWRRPIDQDDIDLLMEVYSRADQAVSDRTMATQAIVATVLQSPWFLFRVEVGRPTSDPTTRELTDHEVASRLSSFLTGAPPDGALMADADAGTLDEDALRGHVQRLLGQPETEGRLAAFFTELLDLERLATVDKDGELFPTMTPSLRAAMAHELEALFTDVVFTQDADVRTVLTSDRAWVTPALAAHYGLPTQTEPGWVTLPADQQRGGLLGRAGFLSLESHATATSPTHRGLFVTTRLLCGKISPPPEGVDTTLPAADASNPMTARQRLTQHAEDPNCSWCHNDMDPMGLPLENYDAIGRYRTTDLGLPIDASGTVGDVPVNGAVELGAAVADDPRLADCLVRQLYRHALGQHESDGEQVALDQLAQVFAQRDHRLARFVEDLVLHPAFRTASPPDPQACPADGITLPCRTECGEGTQICNGGVWLDCSAALPEPEVCNGIDDDCDGTVDEAVRSCDSATGPGLEACDAGAWTGTCEGPTARTETCNGVDDDGDGEVDEDLSIDIAAVSFAEVEAGHPACDPFAGPSEGPCKASFHRVCADRDCSVTGFGPVMLDAAVGRAELACLDSDEAVLRSTTYTELARSFEYCTATDHRWGSHCNAAINRWCRSQGLGTGFGPVENSGDLATVVCTPDATPLAITYDQVAPFSAGEGLRCDGYQARFGPACDVAIHQYCRDRGYRTGHGPTENYRQDLHIACMGTREEG